ncbi:putative cytochrome d ubiquinol oxidase subunit III (Cytochrome bd-I oxidase subunit III) [Xenorhabdus bovienii SS-2004]|uniref:Z-ring associated protein G n=2 Tax=Xenorhabdus bovienii TaxID=40576 RepID=D3V5N0_XENBS|nr:putative cytochrome d ubiquinol oxidase subunit III (Cytochrome bd-I oxidase subunit III) [Xenorhabdus bovienii SS-2004]
MVLRHSGTLLPNTEVNKGVAMTWEYALIGLIIGFIVGALAVRFGSSRLRQQNAAQAELEKNRAELEEYRKELVSHFAHSAELLDNMARDYRQLYQHMAKSSNELMPNMPIQDNPFNYRLTESEVGKSKITSSMPPRDYSEGASGLFRPIQDKKQ